MQATPIPAPILPEFTVPRDASPLEALAAEIAADVDRIEREVRAQVTALCADVRAEIESLRARAAEAELRAEIAEREREIACEQREAAVYERLQALCDGAPGPPGESIVGPPGPPGMLPVVAAWTDGVHYAGAVVTHGGRTWQATRDTGRAPPHEDWLCLAERGIDGADGRGFTIRGTWSESATYAALDVVMLGGSSFVARADDPGKCPGDGWQLLTAAGSRGKPGEPGARGVPGPAGRNIVSLSISAEGVQTLTFDDGKSLSCDFYPVLSRVTR